MIVLEKHDVNAYSPLTLAFLGDSVYEQLVREKLVLTANMPVGKLHYYTVCRVRASYQARAVDVIMPLLDEDEVRILKRGRNATGATVPKNSTPGEYRKATSLETLFGYHYLLDNKERITELFEKIWSEVEVQP